MIYTRGLEARFAAVAAGADDASGRRLGIAAVLATTLALMGAPPAVSVLILLGLLS